MKRLIMWSALVILPLTASAAFGQDRIAPPGGGDKNLSSDDVRSRSLELERVKKDAEKGNSADAKTSEMKFSEIKEDFEKIQMTQDQIITYYTKTKVIDYAKISANAGEMNKSALRLKSNLFPLTPEEKKAAKKLKDVKPVTVEPMPTDVKTLIVNIDNTLAAFVGNPMFTNPKVSNTNANAKARTDLDRLIGLSAALKENAGKMPH